MLEKFYVKSLDIPSEIMPEVASILVANDLTNFIVGSDEEEETITLKIEYDKENRDAFQEILDVIDKYEDSEEEDDDEEDD